MSQYTVQLPCFARLWVTGLSGVVEVVSVAWCSLHYRCGGPLESSLVDVVEADIIDVEDSGLHGCSEC